MTHPSGIARGLPDVKNPVLQQLLRIGSATETDRLILSKVLVYTSHLAALIVPVRNDLAESAERLSSKRRTRMTFFFNSLIEVAPPGTVPVMSLVEEFTKLSHRNFRYLCRVIGGHEFA